MNRLKVLPLSDIKLFSFDFFAVVFRLNYTGIVLMPVSIIAVISGGVWPNDRQTRDYESHRG